MNLVFVANKDVLDPENSMFFDQINSIKFSSSSTSSDLICYIAGERDFMSTMNFNFKHREIREFKKWRSSLNRGRSYKIECEGTTWAMWACDNNGNIVRLNLKPQN